MCFHTSQIQQVEQIEKQYKVKLSDESQRGLFDQPRYHINGFTHSQLLIIPQEKPSVLAAATWGIAPENQKVSELKVYYKEAVKFGGGLNARAEKAFVHFLYRPSIFTKRCIVPVSAFFEPHDHKGKKYPFVFKPKSEGSLSLAGLYTRIDNKVTFTLLTQEASPLFARIHNKKNRQPIILNVKQADHWLDNDLKEEAIANLLKAHFDEDQLNTHAVSTDVFHPKVNSDVEEILDRVEYEELEV
ncbi:SOS response-associated peptidase [Psychroflexus sp. MES1-P1E]|uniref:SOS response-associated peptidase n=1 Tax=Psychroflexus sp. MES1-P1E TaxID=2058320 RepID=UPI000C7DEFD6|nr:SOS response-associated peptidase family protein [Psychroflexus sp. MES1-P1E]PKG44070.1 SOS response-associated peptidase [Psychroflexus sp. MES1-P1E]